MKFRLVLFQSEMLNYNPNLIWFDKIRNGVPGVYMMSLTNLIFSHGISSNFSQVLMKKSLSKLGTKLNFVWCQINRNSVITIRIWFHLLRRISTFLFDNLFEWTTLHLLVQWYYATLSYLWSIRMAHWVKNPFRRTSEHNHTYNQYGALG